MTTSPTTHAETTPTRPCSLAEIVRVRLNIAWPGPTTTSITSFLKVYFRRALEKAGLPFEPHKGARFHDLRHTCGSQWLADGHDIYDVSRWLGHSSVSFTERVYIHDPTEPDFSGAMARRRQSPD